MRKLMQTDFEEIKETNIQLPSSRREIADDLLEQRLRLRSYAAV